MIGRDRPVASRRRSPLFAVACLAAPLLLTGCGSLRQIAGLDQPGPDEFAVESRAPLTIPPDFDLRPPKPGETRPQEVTSAQRARNALNAAGPGQPGDQATPVLSAENEGRLGSQLDPNQQVGPNSLAARLLSSSDNSSGGTVQGRETKPLKGVY